MEVKSRGMDSYLQKTRDEIQRATAGISAAELTWHPHGKWCAAEILEHLTLAFSGTVKGMRKTLAGDEGPVPRRTFKQRLSAFLVADLGYLPSGRKAPAMVVPRGSDGTGMVDAILLALTEMDAVLAEVERKKGPRVRLPHPILGPLTIAQWRKFHLVHTRHHMKQIRRLRELAS